MFMSGCRIHAQSKKKFADKQSIRCYMLKTTGEWLRWVMMVANMYPSKHMVKLRNILKQGAINAVCDKYSLLKGGNIWLLVFIWLALQQAECHLC